MVPSAQDGRISLPLAEGVHRHDAGAAGIGDDGQVAPQGPRHLAQGLGAIKELVNGVHPNDAGPPEGGVIGLVLPGQGPGMGGGGSGGRRTPAGLDHDDGFYPGNRAGGAHEAPVVYQVFHVDDDTLGPVVVPQVVDHLGEINIRHGTHADEVAEADILSLGPVQDSAADGPALGQQRQAAGFGHAGGETGIEIGMGADDAQAVGTEIADAPGLGGGFDLRLDFLPLVPHFLAAGGNDNDAWDFGLAALPHDLRHPQDGDGDDGQVDWRSHRGYRGIGFQPQDLRVLGVNGVNMPLEAVLFKVVHQGETDAALSGAGSHHGDGLRFEELLENMSFHVISLTPQLKPEPGRGSGAGPILPNRC